VPLILIFGATGRVGGATLKALDALADSQRPSIRVFARRPEAVPRTTHRIEVVVGDLDDKATLLAALSGVDSLLLVTSDDRDQIAREKAVIAAAVAARRPRIVKLSAITAAVSPRVSFGKIHGEIEDELRATGLPCTILRPTMFFQSIELFADPVGKSSRLIAPAGRGRVAMIDIADVAEIAAKVLIEKGHDGRIYTLTGSSAPTFAEIASALSFETARDIRYVSPPLFVARTMMAFAGGMDWWLAGQVAELFAAIRNDAESAVCDDAATLLGRPPITLASYIESRRDFWLARQ
jgi:uncharacterized protein YbjT (DUF2867 family)